MMTSFEAEVFKGPAETLGELLEEAARTLCHFGGIGGTPRGHLGGIGEPLSVSKEHLADSQGTRASADIVLDFPEEALVPVDTDPGPPEERTFDSVVLSGCSENTQFNEV